MRYNPTLWAAATVSPINLRADTSWFGFAAAASIENFFDMQRISTPGHTAGHCAVAVRDGDGWLLHAGDAYFDHDALYGSKPNSGFLARMFASIVQADRTARLTTRATAATVSRTF